MISKGRNCPNTEIITTEEGCKQAAKELGLSYSGVVDAASYAAGCFSIQEGVFFNKLVDPSSTYPERFLFSGGVCLNLGIRCIFSKMFISGELKNSNSSTFYSYFKTSMFVEIVGSWSKWNTWTDCSVRCGKGVQTRIRTCNSASAEHQRANCTIDGSSTTETRKCQLDPCIQTTTEPTTSIIMNIFLFISTLSR